MEWRVDGVEIRDNAQRFAQACRNWLRCLGYHAAIEDTYMTPLLPRLHSARANEAAHLTLVHMGEALLRDLYPLTSVSIAYPTQYRLYQKIVALRMAQDDHFQIEEKTILPIIRQQIGEEQQLELTRHLLFDPRVPNDGWIIDWVARHASDTERQLLVSLEKRFDNELPQSFIARMPLP